MKTIQSVGCRVSSVHPPQFCYGGRVECRVTSLRRASARQAGDRMERAARAIASGPVSRACRAEASERRLVTFHLSAFTLIELLVVMAVIGAVAGMLLGVAGAVKKKQRIYNTQAEMAKLETAIERYKAAYGVYPPDNHRNETNSAMLNPLYYELVGTVYDPVKLTYTTLDGTPPVLGTNYVITAFGLGGFVNCTRPGSGEDAAAARSFLSDLKPKQIYNFTNETTGPLGINLLVGSVGGPDANYKPLGQEDLNPWRYNSSNPTNNPGSYDLWIQLVIGGKSNLICNWSKQVLINSPVK